MRFLPSTLVIMVAGPISGRLADRFGPRPLMVGGLLITAISLFWQSRIDVDTATASSPALRPDGPRHRPRDVADEHGRDERGRPQPRPASRRARSRCSAWSAARSASPRSARWSRRRPPDLEQSLPGVPAPARERLAEGLGSGAALDGAPRRW